MDIVLQTAGQPEQRVAFPMSAAHMNLETDSRTASNEASPVLLGELSRQKNSGMQLRYQYRLEPTPAQEVMLARTFGSCRAVFNDALARRKADFEEGRPALSRSALQKAVITDAKRSPERVWLSDVSSVALIQAHNDLLVAFNNFFASLKSARRGQKVGFPRFRSRHDRRQSARFTRNGFELRPNGRLFLAKIGDIKVRWSRALPSSPSSVTVIRDAAGRYFASFVIHSASDLDRSRFPEASGSVGIDLGLKTFAVLSDGTSVAAPKYLRRAERKLRRAQQCLSRKTKGSNNKEKQARRVARIHARVADSRRNFHHQTSTQIIRENQTVVVEGLAVGHMVRNQRLARSISDAGWSSFIAMLEYKALRYGSAFYRIDRFQPTTQRCSNCGGQTGPRGLADLGLRVWTCISCGAQHDRDVNAAQNILAVGLAERQNASGDRTRPSRIPAALAPVRERRTHQSDKSSAQPAP